MTEQEAAAAVERMSATLRAFHEAVGQAHQKVAGAILREAFRQLAWLDAVAHAVAVEAWEGRLAALQDALDGVPGAARGLSAETLTTQGLLEAARSWWQDRFPQAAASLLTEERVQPEDLQSLAGAVASFFTELDRVMHGTDTGAVPPEGRAWP